MDCHEDKNKKRRKSLMMISQKALHKLNMINTENTKMIASTQIKRHQDLEQFQLYTGNLKYIEKQYLNPKGGILDPFTYI